MAEVRVFTLTSIILFTMFMLAIPVQCEKDYVLVDSKPRLPLIIDGVETPPPVRVRPGSEACVLKTTLYVDVDRRYVFDKWSSGEFSRCVKVSENITAYYVEEVLVQVYSREVKEYSRSLWVRVGELVKLKVEPVHYVSGDTRYVFEEWSEGETPFSPENIVAAVKPIKVQVKWVKEHLLTLTSPEKVNGSGWYREGSIAIISAPELIDDGGTRKIFDKWVSVGPYPAVINNPRSPTTYVTVNAPYQITPVYQEFFLVEVYGLGGLQDRRWIERGEIYRIDLKNVVEAVPGEVRYVFKGWRDPNIPQTPSISIEVNSPLRLEAVYERQYYVKVYSDFGSIGEGWYPENSTTIVRVPETPQTILFMKRVLNGWTGDVDRVEINKNVAIVRNINRPVKLAATYTIEIDYFILSIFLGVVGVLLFIGLRKETKRKMRKPEEVEVRAQQKELLKDPSRALFKCTECGITIRGDKEALKHVRRHKFSHPVIDYVALEEIAEPINSKTAILWTSGLKLRITPPNQPTVKDLVKPGDIIRYSETDERLKVASVERHEKHGLPVYTIVGIPIEATNEKKYYKYINDLVAQDGKILCLYEGCEYQVYVEKHAPKVKTTT